MVYTRDVPDLFVAICAYFAAKSLSIQDARIHTTRHGWALDSFIVLLPEGDADLRAQATLVEHELAERLKAPAATAQQPAHTVATTAARASRAFHACFLSCPRPNCSPTSAASPGACQ